MSIVITIVITTCYFRFCILCAFKLHFTYVIGTIKIEYVNKVIKDFTKNEEMEGGVSSEDHHGHSEEEDDLLRRSKRRNKRTTEEMDVTMETGEKTKNMENASDGKASYKDAAMGSRQRSSAMGDEKLDEGEI